MYVLYAKHMRVEKKVDKLRSRIDEFGEVVSEAASKFFWLIWN